MFDLISKLSGTIVFSLVTTTLFNITPRDDFVMFSLCTFATMVSGVIAIAWFFLTIIKILHLINKE